MSDPDIHDILSGIGQTEASGGWWETSTGAEFGQRKMREIEAYVEAAVVAERERCAKVAETCPDSHWWPWVATAIRKGEQP